MSEYAPEPTGELDQEWLTEAATPDSDRADRYDVFETYYDGRLGSPSDVSDLTDRVRRYLERSGLPFVENFCDMIVDVVAERLSVTGFSASGSSSLGKLADLEGWLDDLWRESRLDASQDDVHTTALMKGDAYLIVEGGEDMPAICFNDPRLIAHCAYDAERPNEISWASKVWDSSARGPQNENGAPVQRLNIYHPDRCERYFRLRSSASGDTTGGWQRWSDGDGVWPIPWVRPDGSPRGVPVFHFRPRSLGRDYGRSELAAAIPFQDEITKQVIDLAEILDYLGWPQRWASGVSGDTTLTAHAGTMLKLADPDAKVGQFEAADPTGALAAIEGTLSRLARRSRVPMHLLTGGTPPSGEALKTAESGLVAKVKKLQVPFGDAWESAMRCAILLAVDAGTLELPTPEDELGLETQWADPETRNEKTEAETAQILAELGVSEHSILASLGYDYEEEARWREREESTMAKAAGDMLDGVPPNGAGGTVYMAPPQMTVQSSGGEVSTTGG